MGQKSKYKNYPPKSKTRSESKTHSEAKRAFAKDVFMGLTSTLKYLDSKYFYNKKGDKIFQEIMNCPEYYLTRCELEIFSKQTDEICDTILDIPNSNFEDISKNDIDLIELGPGDAFKSIYVLQRLTERGVNFTYYPIDISKNVISGLNKRIPKVIPNIKIQGITGDYFEGLRQLQTISSKRKVVLFLGSSIGNIPLIHTKNFLDQLYNSLNFNDQVLIGFDLKKDPGTILAAYCDKDKITERFNLNLLTRINKELYANFKLSHFEHSPRYNPTSGECKSYLKSLKKHTVIINISSLNNLNKDNPGLSIDEDSLTLDTLDTLGSSDILDSSDSSDSDTISINFEAGELIFTELSQKYTIEQTDTLAEHSGFIPIKKLLDESKFFLDSIWLKGNKAKNSERRDED